MALSSTTGTRTDPFLDITWTDPVTGCRGYLVIDSLMRGVACGGLRMRPGCSHQELRDLGHAMTLKEAIHAGGPEQRYIPVGGAKGGIDFDPESPEAPGVLERFVQSFLPVLQTMWVTGDDLGINLDWIDRTLHDAGLTSAFDAALGLVGQDADSVGKRVDTTARIDVDGVDLGDLVGGYGVAVSILRTLKHRGTDPRNTRAVLQGFGNMGGATARYLARAGVRVVGVADVDGLIFDENGLDVEFLLRLRTPTGRIQRDGLPETASLLARDAWLSVDADILVPAATPYVINADNVDDVTASIIAEAANAPTTGDAEQVLSARGVTVLPDFLCNSATNAWWWWLVFGDITPDVDDSFARIDGSVGDITTDVLKVADATGRTVRDVATERAAGNLSGLKDRYPRFWLHQSE
jgi:glutamate dehydrogenase (NAD(P)+)